MLQIFLNLRMYFSNFFLFLFCDLRKFFRLVKGTINYMRCMKKNRRKRKNVHFFIVCFKILFCRVITEMLSIHWTNQNVCGVSKFNTFFFLKFEAGFGPILPKYTPTLQRQKISCPKNLPVKQRLCLVELEMAQTIHHPDQRSEL